MDQIARIFQINASNGGVPKRPLRSAEVNESGITVDRQRDTIHHGGPDRALCLFSLERIRALQTEGHPIFPGATGENVTVTGLDWGQIVPGTRLALGREVVIEVTKYTAPCHNIRGSFLGEEFSRLAQKKHPGWSRVYARVLRTGRIKLGDAVTLLQGPDAEFAN
ncbi:MAG: MOSC domain-containing protein [Anaerolineae bacterium]